MPPEPGDTSGDNWKNEIPEDYRKSTLISETKSVADLAKFAVETQQMLGTAIRIPSEHASDADREAFQKRLTEIGMVPKATFREVVRPKDPGDYKYENGVDEKLGITQTEMDVWKLEAHSLGLSSEQFNDYAGQQVKAREVALDAQQAAFNTADTALKDEWGDHAFESKKQQALNALKRFGSDELAARMDANPDPNLMRAFAEIGKQFEEAGLGDLDIPQIMPETRDEAATKLAEIRANKDHPFNRGPLNIGETAYSAAAAEVMRLREISMGLRPSRDFMFEDTA